MKTSTGLCLVLMLAATVLLAQTPKYGVTVKADRKTDFSKFKSYAWETGQPSFDKNVHQQIIDAVDRELKTVGLEKRASGPADVTVTYGSLHRTDVDLDAKPTGKEATRSQYAVGSLLVLMHESGTHKEVFRARADKPIDLAPGKVQGTIDEVVAEMFAKYPRSKK